jgi:hypothetical protein
VVRWDHPGEGRTEGVCKRFDSGYDMVSGGARRAKATVLAYRRLVIPYLPY